MSQVSKSQKQSVTKVEQPGVSLARGKTKRWQAKSISPTSRRFTPEQRAHAVTLARSGMKRVEVAAVLGTTAESVRRWVLEARKAAEQHLPLVETGTVPACTLEPVEGDGGGGSESARSSVARDPGQGLSEQEESAILELKKRHPSYGPAQLRAQLKRFWGWRLSVKAIARVMKSHGYELVWRGSRPKGDQPISFEAPRRNALWQFDFTGLTLAGEKLHLLVALDDYSRFVVGHAVADSPSSQVATQVLHQAIARHGKPEAVRTDRGGAFVAKTTNDDFARVLECELIDHIVGRAYHPQGGGKVESLIGTIRRELWETEHMPDRHAAERRIAEFLDEYNHRRAHMGINGLTPADRFHGRADQVLARIDAISRNRQGTWARMVEGQQLFEEHVSGRSGAPLEVLRLLIRDGVMELAFCGSRVRLGHIEC